MAETDTLLDTAFQAYNQNQFETAEEIVRNVLTIAPTNGDALYLLGLIAYRSNALEPAEKLLYEAVKLYPDMSQYALALAGVLQKAGRLDEALSFYEKYKQNPLVLSQIGYIYLQKGQNDFAKSAFDEALKEDETCLNAKIGQALLARQEGRNEEALQLLTMAEKSGVKDSELFYQLAVQNRLCGHYQEAFTAIKNALSLFETAVFLNEKGLIFEALGFESSAQEAYERAIELDPYAPDAFANLGNLYLKQGNNRRAEEYYKKALALDADFLNAHHNLAIALCKQDRKAEGLEHYRSALLINPRHISSLYNLAMILEETGDFSEAAGLYFNILTLKAHPEMIDFRIANTLARLSEEGKKSKKEALDFAKGWVKHFPENEIAVHTLNALQNDRKNDVGILTYARGLFDAFAPTYDETMQQLEAKGLSYATDYLNQTAREKYAHVLDLACGTGQFAELFQKKYDELTGVDISEKMLDLARAKNRYTRLIQNDVISFLETDTVKYDLILAVELTNYLSELTTFFTQTAKHLMPDGLFVMTNETNEKEDIFLSPQGRYLYRKSYVEETAKKAGLIKVFDSDFALRKEGTAYAKGTLFVFKTTADCGKDNEISDAK